MGRILPILFNGDMVRAILDGRKTVTRRKIDIDTANQFDVEHGGKSVVAYINQETGDSYDPKEICRYQPGDVLYVRETFCWCPCWDCGLSTEDGSSLSCTESEVYDKVYNAKRAEWGCWCYKASCDAGEEPSVDTWHPSIHMPKDIARIWLKVTDVRVERLHKMEIGDYKAEGILPVRPEGLKGSGCDCAWKNDGCEDRPCSNRDAYNNMCYQHVFIDLWDSTIKPAEHELYGWQADPWVWVIGFERCRKPEPCIMKGIEPAEDKRPCIGYGDAWADEPCEMCKGCTSCSGNM